MYAITQTEPGPAQTLTWAEMPTPIAGPGEVLIKIAAAGVNRADLLQRQGYYPPPPGSSSIIGLECSGTVAGLGPDAGDWETQWTVGSDCVALLAGGGYAEYVAVPYQQVVAPPAGVDLISVGGLIEVAATVSSMTAMTGLASGEVFCVHGGAGGIGSFAIQYARALGARVITTAGSPDKVAYCQDLGADQVINYHDDWVTAIRDATAGAGANVILDVIGAKYLARNVDALATDGRLAVIGLQGGTKAELDLRALLNKRATVLAASLRSRPVAQKGKICAAVAQQVWPMVTDGRVRIPRETRIPLAEAARAHELLESGTNIGKIILTGDRSIVES